MKLKHDVISTGPPDYSYVGCRPGCPACLTNKLLKENKELKAEVEALKKVPCRHDVEAAELRRRDDGYF